MASVSAPEIVLWPGDKPLRLQLVSRWDDLEGAIYYPAVHVAFRAWNDDTVTAWQALELDDFVLRRDTIIVHLERLLIVDAVLGGANFSFRARLSSVGIQTDWVRLSESVRFYERRQKGVPRQPEGLRLLR